MSPEFLHYLNKTKEKLVTINKCLEDMNFGEAKKYVQTELFLVECLRQQMNADIDDMEPVVIDCVNPPGLNDE